MFAKGRNYLQAKIDLQNDIFEVMLSKLPELIQEEIRQTSAQKQKEAEEAADGDPEKSELKNSHLNYLEDIEYMMTEYFYYAMVIMLYSYAESSLLELNKKAEEVKKTKKKDSKLQKYYNSLCSKYPSLPHLDETWKEYSNFNKLRNSLAHEMKTVINSKHKTGYKLTNDYLQSNLSQIYNMLKLVSDKIENR